ncbi:MAG: hypothetical protein FWG87_14270 [Defluviitaleaceae bacterium]|nr:hypothetical protein [Defluviitaleaceae bacterium]
MSKRQRNNGRYPTQIDERTYLGTDKSVPYKNLRFPLTCGLTNDLCNTDLTDFHGFGGFVRARVFSSGLLWEFAVFRRGRIYPSRGYLALR